MSGRDCDIAIVGGGLAGGLTALALNRARPDLALRVIEAGARPGGNHRWSWFASDLSPAGTQLLAPIRKAEWDAGNHVAFPGYERDLDTPYRSMASADLAAALARELPEGSILAGREAASLDAREVRLRDDSRITARVVIDARGFSPTGALRGGWQVFMGRHLHLTSPHGLDRPTIMDASVEQLGGYRFVYVLPLANDEVFVEDTYYQDTPVLDRSALSSRLDVYCRTRGWDGDIIGNETGVLPVITGGDFAAFQDGHAIDGVATIGARGGFVHPLTSYTLPFAVETALAIAADAELPGDQLAAKMASRARAHWRAMRYYRLLGDLLFGAAVPEERYRVFERFYRLPAPLIERFYAGRSTLADKSRILAGKPPVPILQALRAMLTARPRLIDSGDKR